MKKKNKNVALSSTTQHALTLKLGGARGIDVKCVIQRYVKKKTFATKSKEHGIEIRNDSFLVRDEGFNISNNNSTQIVIKK